MTAVHGWRQGRSARCKEPSSCRAHARVSVRVVQRGWAGRTSRERPAPFRGRPAGPAARIADAGDQQTSGGCADVVGRLRNAGERRLGRDLPRHVVEAHDGHVVGARWPALVDRLQDAERHGVVRAEDARWADREVEQLVRGRAGRLALEARVLHERRVEGQSGGFKPLHVAAPAFAADVVPFEAADIAIRRWPSDTRCARRPPSLRRW